MLDALDQGWSDPRKLSQQSAKAAILRDEAFNSLAAGLGVPVTTLEIIGENSLANFYAITGLIQSNTILIHSAVDRKEVFALAGRQMQSSQLLVDLSGHILLTKDQFTKGNNLLALQGANIETGVIQPLEEIINSFPDAAIALDFTASGPRLGMPSGWTSAAFDATSWQGPTGIGVVAIAQNARWTNPLPHLDKNRTPGTYSLPLLLSAAVALDGWLDTQKTEKGRLNALSARFRQRISESISDCDIAGNLHSSMEHKTSLSFLYVEGEELLRTLEGKGFSVDSGSACSSENLQPSHVLAAMGVLTHGNVRVNFHHGTHEADVDALVDALIACVAKLRAQ